MLLFCSLIVSRMITNGSHPQIPWALTSKRGGHEGVTTSQLTSLGHGCLLCKLSETRNMKAVFNGMGVTTFLGLLCSCVSEAVPSTLLDGIVHLVRFAFQGCTQCPALMCAWPAQSAPLMVITPRPSLYPYNLPQNTSDNSENLGALELYFSGCGDIPTVTLVFHGSPGLVGWAGVPLSPTALVCHFLSCRQT